MAVWAEQLQRELAGRGLAVASVPGKGRGLVAARSFFPGEVIICQEPYASTPNRISVGSSCDHCFASGNLRKCSVCRVAWYCGSVCQKEEWKLHQLECQAISALTEERKKMLTPTIRLMVKLILRRKLQSEKMANLVQLILPSIELDLKEIAHTFSKSFVCTEVGIAYCHVLEILAVIGSLRPNPLGLGSAVIAVHPTQVQFACNAHTICDPELRPLGTGLFPAISIINHRILRKMLSWRDTDARTKSVMAFCCLTRERRLIHARNVAFLEMKKSNIDNSEAGSVYKTIEQLEQKHYHSFSTTLLHTRETLLKAWRANVKTSQSFGYETHLGESSTRMGDLLGSPRERVSYLAYPNLFGIKGFVSIPLLQIYMELQDWQTALMYCRLTIPVYERVYPPFHPMVGLQFYTCGKLEWLLEYTEDALKSLTRAADVLRITHGTQSQFMKELFGYRLETSKFHEKTQLTVMTNRDRRSQDSGIGYQGWLISTLQTMPEDNTEDAVVTMRLKSEVLSREGDGDKGG
uniref:Zf-MYND domain-containing protein n=1 Tax=Triticum aestivum TaxID=4565 RepID=I3NM62_WHEAT|nr:zf-MYND domain-containing protein [Triticum aestivum]